jgi:hypothetical protein
MGPPSSMMGQDGAAEGQAEGQIKGHSFQRSKVKALESLEGWVVSYA